MPEQQEKLCDTMFCAIRHNSNGNKLFFDNDTVSHSPLLSKSKASLFDRDYPSYAKNNRFVRVVPITITENDWRK